MTHAVTVNPRDHWHGDLSGSVRDRRFGSIDDAIEAGLRALADPIGIRHLTLNGWGEAQANSYPAQVDAAITGSAIGRLRGTGVQGGYRRLSGGTASPPTRRGARRR